MSADVRVVNLSSVGDPGAIETFRAMFNEADSESVEWILFAFVSYMVLTFVLTLQKSERISSVNKMVSYAVMFIALSFVFVFVAVKKAREADALGANLILVVVTGVTISVLVVRWLGQRKNVDKVIGATVFSAAYFVCFGFFGKMSFAYGSGVLMGTFFGFVIGAMVYTWRDLKQAGELEKEESSDINGSKGSGKRSQWERSKRM